MHDDAVLTGGVMVAGLLVIAKGEIEIRVPK